MAITWLYSVFLFIVYSGPTVLTLWSTTYNLTTAARFITFLCSVILFVLMGRSLKKRHRPRFFPGLIVGGLVAMVGTAFSQYLRHLPMAENALFSQIPGVPRAAAITMLHLHALTSAILSASIFSILFGLFGAIATWWGGRDATHRQPEDSPSKQPERAS